MSDIGFEERETSILCYDGLCDSCKDEHCEHDRHYHDPQPWKRSLEAIFLRVGIASIPVSVADALWDDWRHPLAVAGSLLVAFAVARWFERDREVEQ